MIRVQLDSRPEVGGGERWEGGGPSSRVPLLESAFRPRASSLPRTRSLSPEQRIDQLERALLQLEVEATALQREEDAQSKARLTEVRQRPPVPPPLPPWMNHAPSPLRPPGRWRRRWPASRTSCSPSSSATKPRSPK